MSLIENICMVFFLVFVYKMCFILMMFGIIIGVVVVIIVVVIG